MTINTIGFIGVGNMGSAMIKGLIAKNIISASSVNAFDIQESVLNGMRDELGINTVGSNTELVQGSDIVILAVKPQVLKDVLVEIADTLTDAKPVITIVAGVPMAFYDNVVGKKFPLARCMPNTPALVNAGATAVAFNDLCDASFKEDAMNILGSIGSVHEVAEKHLDAVTGLSGSGPAYVFYFIDGMIDAGVRMGLPRDLARALVLDTVAGSVKLVKDTGKHPMVLKDQVTSPGGTTVDGLQVLDEGAFRATIVKAVEAATKKSKKLSDNLLH
ncbi:MAG TPA: pyrroline-5-carboxylate reductase [Candidatus Lokiarchaeia archaeon]|nr:pyrroline-5-carboxylate reductase [Candidatus Lokiarchaeia archaeon]